MLLKNKIASSRSRSFFSSFLLLLTFEKLESLHHTYRTKHFTELLFPPTHHHVIVNIIALDLLLFETLYNNKER